MFYRNRFSTPVSFVNFTFTCISAGCVADCSIRLFDPVSDRFCNLWISSTVSSSQKGDGAEEGVTSEGKDPSQSFILCIQTFTPSELSRVSDAWICSFQNLTNSLRSERRLWTLYRLLLELTLLTPPGPLEAPTRRLNAQKTPSLPCRLFLENLNLSLGLRKGPRSKWFLQKINPSSPISPLTGCGVASDHHLLVVLKPQCYSNMQRSSMFTVHTCVLLYLDVLIC